MKRNLATGLLSVVLLTGASTPANAVPLEKSAQKCRDGIAKFFAKAVTTADRVSTSCHAGRLSGHLPPTVDCNDLSTLQADNGGKFQKALQKLQSTIAKSCKLPTSVQVLARFASCPYPCGGAAAGGAGGASPSIDNFVEVGQCLSCMATDIMESRSEEMFGTPSIPVSGSAARCQLASARVFSKHLKTLLKERQGCQRTDDKLVGTLDLQPCDTSDLKLRIAGVLTLAQATVAAECTDSDLESLDTCGNVVADVQDCLTDAASLSGLNAFTTGYEVESLCGNGGPPDPGEECDGPGETAGCDPDCTFAVCGDGYLNVTAGEECDGGQCCVACEYAAEGTPCNDGSICTDPDACNATGSCIGSDDPDESCTPAPTEGSLLKLRDKGVKDRLSWKWGKNADPLELPDFADPINSQYTLCMYAPAYYKQLILQTGALWVNKDDKLFKYKDKLRSPHGVSSAQMKPGLMNRAKIQVKAKGANLGLSNLGAIPSSLSLQFRNPAGACFSASFAGPFSDNYKGKSE